MATEEERQERTVEQRDAVIEPWHRMAIADGWEADGDVLYWAAVDGIAWALIENSMDTSDRQPSQELHREARRTAEALIGATLDRSRPGLGTAGVAGAQPDEPASQAGRPVAGGAG